MFKDHILFKFLKVFYASKFFANGKKNSFFRVKRLKGDTLKNDDTVKNGDLIYKYIRFNVCIVCIHSHLLNSE